MTQIKMLGGTANKKLRWDYSFGQITGRDTSKFSQPVLVRTSPKAMKQLEVADETTGVKVLGAVGWGTVGAVIAGPLGALVGGIIGGRGETITFVAEFPDGKTLMGQVPKKAWIKMLAERM